MVVRKVSMSVDQRALHLMVLQLAPVLASKSAISMAGMLDYSKAKQ